MDATKAPITANVTIAAAGIEAADKSKCFIANTYASVGDFESVSTTRVFLVCSSILSALVTHHAIIAPRTDKRHEGTNKDNPKEVDVVTKVFDEPPATSTKVEKIPRAGRKGDIF